VEIVIPLLMGLSLAATAGLRAFLPLLGLALAAHFGLVHLNGRFAWLQSGAALVVLAIAAVAEMLADKIPVVDHALDALQTVVRPMAGVVAVAGTQAHMDPLMAGVMGLVLGAPLAGSVHVAKGGVRLASTAATAGFANPLLSLAEDVVTAALAFLSLFAPVIAFLVVLLMIFFGLRLWYRARQRRAKAA